MAQDLPVNALLVIPAAELQWRFSRASGPGGQGVNTTDSRVELVFDLERSRVLGPFRRERLREALGGRLVDGCVRVVAAEGTFPVAEPPTGLGTLGDLLREGLKPPPPQRKPTRPGARRCVGGWRPRAVAVPQAIPQAAPLHGGVVALG